MNLARYISMRAPSPLKNQNNPKPASVHSEAKIEVWPWPHHGTIRLEGDLGVLVFALKHPGIAQDIKGCLPRGEPITIDARDISLVPQEVDEWVDFVETELSDWELRYRPSQLSEVLRYHDGYSHAHSTFEAYGEEDPRDVRHMEFAVLSVKELSDTLSARRKCVRNGAVNSDNVVVNLSRPTSACVPA